MLLARRAVFDPRVRGRQRNMICEVDIQPVWRADEPQKLYHIIIVVERLAYSHQNDSVYPFARVALRSYHLTEYLGRTQMTDKPANSRRTEAAAHPTADLSRDADGIAMLVLHNDALDALPVRTDETDT